MWVLNTLTVCRRGKVETCIIELFPDTQSNIGKKERQESHCLGWTNLQALTACEKTSPLFRLFFSDMLLLLFFSWYMPLLLVLCVLDMLLLLFFSWYMALLLVLCVLQQMPCCFPSSPIKRYPFALQGPWLKQREFDHLFICLFSPLKGRILLVENYFGIFLLLLKTVTNICQFFCLCLREKLCISSFLFVGLFCVLLKTCLTPSATKKLD